MRFHFLPLSMLAALALAAPALSAQLAGGTEIITGTVLGPDGRPVEGARVEVTSVETQVTRARVTNARGQFTILFADGGGQYTLTVRHLGSAPYQMPLQRQGDEDRIVVTVQLSTAATVLPRVVTRAPVREPPAPGGRPEPGNLERVLTPEQLARLPLDASDLAEIAAMAPGVVAMPGTDSTAAGFSVAGQRPNQNATTLDGAAFAGATVPSEAVRVTRVITNSYDVARGQFTGGQVATTTRSGTNRVQGTFTYGMRDPSLQWEDETLGSFGEGYREHTLSGGLGGPVRRNRLFAFGSFQLRRRSDPLESLAAADEAALARTGVAPDSVARFLALLERESLPPLGSAPAERRNDNVTLLGRLDWTMSDAHSLTLRGDLRLGDQRAARIGPLSVPHAGGRTRSDGYGALLTARSQLGAAFINEARAYLSRDARDADPYFELPQGRVRVVSDLAAGGRAVSVLEFGGNAALPQRTDNASIEVSDEASWVQPGGAHRLKLGVNVQRTEFDELAAANRRGTFTFNSLADLDTGRAASFSRTLRAAPRTGGLVTPAVYAGDIWRVRRGWQIDYGVRVEGNSAFGAPALNPAVAAAFGRRTDRLPRDVAVSPRLGFSWTRPAARGASPLTVRGGVGDFRARMPTSLFAAALDASGLLGAQSQIVCVGAAVPDADWTGFRDGTMAFPEACASGAPPQLGTSRRAVTVFDPSFAAPRAWRASLGTQRRLRDRFTIGVDAIVAWGRSQYGVVDRNLVEMPRFTLDAEDGRPVFVDPPAIVGRTGAVSLAGSRRDTTFAQVFEFHSGLRSRTMQLIAGFGGLTTLGLAFNATYTWTQSIDQSSFTCCLGAQGFASPTTAGHPNRAEWGRSEFERRHAFMATATWPFTAWLEVTAIGRLTSGAAYTPLVGGDVNGDGARNDRAFIFDPDFTADVRVASGMRSLLDAAPGSARDCLVRQLSRLAGRNSCRGSWTSALDFQANLRPDAFGLARRLTLSLVTVNTLPGIDRLLNGEAGARGWGLQRRPDPTLLYVRGFDPQTLRFRYEVNGRFGDERALRLGQQAPFMIALQARLSVGPDPGRERIRQLFGAGGARGGGGARNAAGEQGPRVPRAIANVVERGGDPAVRFRRMVPNPILRILAMRDSLGLTPAQDSALLALNERHEARADSAAAQVADAVRKAGANPDMPTLLQIVGPRLAEARESMRVTLDEAARILTPDQWRRLPPALRDPGAAPERLRRP